MQLAMAESLNSETVDLEDKNMFSDSVKRWMMMTSIELYTSVRVSITLTYFTGEFKNIMKVIFSSFESKRLSIFSSCLAGASTEGCPSIVLRSQEFSKVHNGTCYLFVNKERYWQTARSDCWNMGGEMLSLRDDKTMKFIRSVLNSPKLRWHKQGVWLGASYRKGRWQWTTGELIPFCLQWFSLIE